jgi:hypothetical protein
MGGQRWFGLFVLAAGIGRTAAAIDDAAAVKVSETDHIETNINPMSPHLSTFLVSLVQLSLNVGQSTIGAMPCPDGDNFRFHDAAITLSGSNVTMADVTATWDGAAKTFTTSGGEVFQVDTTKATPTITTAKVR